MTLFDDNSQGYRSPVPPLYSCDSIIDEMTFDGDGPKKNFITYVLNIQKKEAYDKIR